MSLFRHALIFISNSRKRWTTSGLPYYNFLDKIVSLRLTISLGNPYRPAVSAIHGALGTPRRQVVYKTHHHPSAYLDENKIVRLYGRLESMQDTYILNDMELGIGSSVGKRQRDTKQII